MITLARKLLGGLSPYLTSILVGLLLAAGGATYWIYNGLLDAQQEARQAQDAASGYLALADARQAALGAAVALHERTVLVLTIRAETAEQLNLKHKERSDALDKALTASPDWSNTPVPDSVRAALEKP